MVLCFAACLRPIIGLAAFSFAAVAGAQTATEGSLSLDWEAPAGCPGRDAVLERTKALTSRTLAPGEAIRARGVVTVRSDTAGEANVWRLTLETTQRSRSWQRSVEAASCEELMEAGALVLALAIDPSLESRDTAPPNSGSTIQSSVEKPSSAPPPPQTRTNDARATEVVPPNPSRTSAPPSQQKLEFSADASAIVDFGSLPRAALGVEGAIGIAIRVLRLEAVGTFFPEVRAEIAQGPSRGGDIGLWALGGRGSYGARWRRLTVEGRLGFELGQMHGTGFGGSAWNSERTSVWAAGRAGLGAHLDWGRFRLQGAVEAGVQLVRPKFVFEGLEQVHRPAAVFGRVAFGIGVHF